MANRRYVALIRKSGKEKGNKEFNAGLSAAEQKAKIEAALKSKKLKGPVVEWVYENGSGRKVVRSALQHALASCTKNNATLVTATIDRLSRRLPTTLKVLDNTDVLFAEFPEIDRRSAETRIAKCVSFVRLCVCVGVLFVTCGVCLLKCCVVCVCMCMYHRKANDCAAEPG